MSKRRRRETPGANGAATQLPAIRPAVVHGQARARREAENRSARRRRGIRLWGVVGSIGAAGVLVVLWQTGALIPHLGREVRNEGGVGVHLAPGTALPQSEVPPASGPHYTSRASYGVSQVAVEPGAWLHALEHGRVVVLYRCATGEDCSATAGQLEADVYARARPGAFGERKLVISPYADLPTPIAELSWGRIVELETPDASQILAFYDRYLDRGPERAS